MRILLVEDDPSIAVSLVDGLEAAGHQVAHSATGTGALAAFADAANRDTVEQRIELVLLDLGLPDMDGRDVCRALRASSDVPIIMLTARGDEIDRVLGLELGADDYVTKPFSFRELVARIRAIGRRLGVDGSIGDDRRGVAPGDGAETDAGVSAAQTERLAVDRRTRRVHLDGVEVVLTAKEFDLLAYLASDSGAVRTRTDILEHVWDANWFGPTKTVDAHVAALRKKLGDARWIEAVRGVGFRLEPPR